MFSGTAKKQSSSEFQTLIPRFGRDSMNSPSRQRVMVEDDALVSFNILSFVVGSKEREGG